MPESGPLLWDISKFLNRRFNDALDQTPLYVHWTPPRYTSLEVFMCGLYIKFGRAFSRYFEKPAAVHKMCGVVCPGVRRFTPARVRRALSSLPAGTGVAVVYDRELLQLLWSAATITAATRRRKISLDSFIAALALDLPAQELLARKWKVKLRSYWMTKK